MKKRQAAVMVLALFGAWSAWAVDLAKVNSRVITEKDMRMALGGLNEGQRENLLKDPNTRRQVLNNVIDQELLMQEGEKEKLDQDPDYRAALEVFKKQYLVSRTLEKNIGSKLTDKEAQKFYESNKRRFSTDQVHAMHILVSTEGEAREILKKLKEPGADFQAIAEANSKDPSAKNNRGDLGFFGRGRMVSEFTDPVFAAGKGEIIGPIHTAYGYHIVKVIEKKAGKAMEYHEVELQVKSELKEQLKENYVLKLRNQAKVQVNENELEKL